jgi:hypothetical protein
MQVLGVGVGVDSGLAQRAAYNIVAELTASQPG